MKVRFEILAYPFENIKQSIELWEMIQNFQQTRSSTIYGLSRIRLNEEREIENKAITRIFRVIYSTIFQGFLRVTGCS